MCLCTRMHCLNRTGGSGCLKCEWACDEAINQSSDKRPYFDSDMNCVCPVCFCQCSVIYYRHEEKRLAVQAKEEYFLQIDKKPQAKLDSFFGFTNAIADLAQKRTANQDGAEARSVLGLTSEDLLQSIKLQEDTDLRNSLQLHVGMIDVQSPIKIGGSNKSLAELRREARIKRFVSPNKANSHLPKDDAECSIVTPISTMGLNNNSRWYRNDLSNLPINPPIASPNATQQKSANLKKAVMKRLLHVSSPTTNKKRKCLTKLIENDVGAATVVDLAVEMGSSIKETKQMIMNNCID